MAVVVNNSTRAVTINELRQIIPCDGKFYTVPEDVARRYASQLIIVPPNVVLAIEKKQAGLDEGQQRLQKQIEIFEKERELFKKEKEYYDQLLKNVRIKDAKNKHEWELKIKNKTDYPVIDFLYSFHFNGKDREKAIERLRASIKSIRGQNVRICLCNTSKESIHADIKDLAKIDYYHKPLNLDVYCKPQTINIGVKKLVRTNYFILSDIDLIYPETFISELNKYTVYYKPVRVVFNNYNIGTESYKKTFKEYKKFFNTHGDKNRTRMGIAPGNGLVHLKSFKRLNGFDEYYKGYGLEDADFNLRISYICKMIELDNTSVNTCHLFHENKGCYIHDDRYIKNIKYYEQRKLKLLNEIGSGEFNTYNDRKHLKLIKV